MVFSVLGILIFFTFFYKLGPTFFVKLSLLLPSSSYQAQKQEEGEWLAPINPPRLEPLGTATNSANITIKGLAQKGLNVELFLNGQSKGKILTGNDDKFTFSNISLTSGKNRVYVKVTNSSERFLTSDDIFITYKDQPPSLELDNPKEGETITAESPEIKISGQTEIGASLTVNDHQAIVKTDGTFEYLLTLTNGENTIKLVVRDEAGNQTQVVRKIIYKPST